MELKGGECMQVSMDGTVKYAGHKVINYKDGRQYVALSTVDEKNEPINFFCPGTCLPAIKNCTFGDDISITFDVNEYQNRLNLRVKEVAVYGR